MKKIHQLANIFINKGSHSFTDVLLTVNVGLISSTRLATSVIVHVIAVLKSKSFPFNVHPPNVYPALVGSDGLVAFDPYATL